MGLDISIRDGVILMTVKGPWGGTQGQEALVKTSEASRANQIYQILIDIRQADIEASTLDIYQVTSSISGHFPPGTKFAMVQKKEERTNVAGEFFETVAANRGIMAKVFNDMDSALAWLRK